MRQPRWPVLLALISASPCPRPAWARAVVAVVVASEGAASEGAAGPPTAPAVFLRAPFCWSSGPSWPWACWWCSPAPTLSVAMTTARGAARGRHRERAESSEWLGPGGLRPAQGSGPRVLLPGAGVVEAQRHDRMPAVRFRSALRAPPVTARDDETPRPREPDRGPRPQRHQGRAPPKGSERQAGSFRRSYPGLRPRLGRRPAAGGGRGGRSRCPPELRRVLELLAPPRVRLGARRDPSAGLASSEAAPVGHASDRR